MAEVSIAGVKREASLQLLPMVKKGDYILLHAGFAIQKIDPAQAKETLALIKKYKYL